MTLVLIGVSAVSMLLALTWGGPLLIRTAAPVLMRAPRIAVACLLSVSFMWWAAVAGLSLMTAWLLKGPDILPDPLANVCQRCLVAASPLAGAQIETLVPVILFLLFPLALSLLSLSWGARQAFKRKQANNAVVSDLLSQARDTDIDGHTVKKISALGPVAFSLPRQYGGIVVSEELCSRLSERELTAVLEHERAHVDQGHHRIMNLVETFFRPLSIIPFFAEVAAAIPHYLEIAADDRARKAVGTPCLASALLKVGTRTQQDALPTGVLTLNIAGPDRIQQLVAPADMTRGVLPVIALTSVFASFVALFGSVSYSYASVLLSGCVIP